MAHDTKEYLKRNSTKDCRRVNLYSEEKKEKLYSFTNEIMKMVKEQQETKKINTDKCKEKCKLSSYDSSDANSKVSSKKTCKCSEFKKASLSVSFKSQKQKSLANMRRYHMAFKKIHDELKVRVLTLEMEKMNTTSNEKILENGQMET